ncbi:GNAT family N-acetyltransferase [Enterovibrio norvegicus FF-33]|uniref:GNAT family N-acetyltransferase n=1 Tax=Enterovibrio norvegicus FF-454 TaxID=1185651 RepID=A0A1E5C5R5_9GAMM|nr:GNAT family N-acetyltransferase [Enterovibrio norvegicus]OEE60823.1 GNAT family N-acetyltransferase [Enterovibrio norvegicus FF-454]OEE67408.1 GNAT family N-acetyltransferase [Enterovibrio norvegicus FF-33]OEE74563.1 GNAT family N-acetyltransferase [Enterovibrio norvegicus FF-162]
MLNTLDCPLDQKVTFAEVPPRVVPPSLLLEADPSAASIASYLLDSWCFAGFQNKVVIAACVIKKTDTNLAELFNISVSPEFQGSGYGTDLLKHVIQFTRNKKIKRLELGTGTFGHQLAFYQRMGFRVSAVIKNHFLDNYDEPIWEKGVQHKDMLRLYLDL